ncbi:TlpA disulfide reductase family protein [Gilvibacter sp.]|uniref:TlpA family protein disulfide reductase n=1 Tax=Gilvibacter sp. TaxID=2729997 RepID=UPI0025C55455|nr:TlpA disulfide reductase family protein [Gilvibacter sp.]NQX76113.1 TlpA family protein disulfide reductase [Gilvibacter sp.]
MRFLLPFFCALILVSCGDTEPQIKTGDWRATLELEDQILLPFNLEFKADGTAVIRNADERITITNISIQGDTVTLAHPVFAGVFEGVLSDDMIKGDFVIANMERSIPFEMVFGDGERFKETNTATADVSGTWEITFIEDDWSTYPAQGVFEQNDNSVTGTIRTETGDYRYLEGVVDGSDLKLSTFDGAHSFLFTAKVTDSTLKAGTFYSGNHYKAGFNGKLNPQYELTDPDSLTFLKPGYDRFNFAFPDAAGKTWTLDDPQFKDKVVVVQLMGTWCPNCLDETEYFADYISRNPNSEVEFIALAIDFSKTPEPAFKAIDRLKSRFDLKYPIVLAQYGTDSKSEASDKLPMLNAVLSYPTTIVVDKKGEVRKIHTGFNGPATGAKYTEFVTSFEAFLDDLIAE